MLQMNLREIDFPLDVDRYLREAKAYKAEVLLFNAGGISANYPSRHPFHHLNPRIKGRADALKALSEGTRRLGIRLVARFDFSKVNAALGCRHPEWLYKSLKGRPVDYNGQLHTCPSGDYQQIILFEILDEALSRYAIDGVFINMFGFFTWDYSHNYHGICQCASCRKRFGSRLPRKEDPADPLFRRYRDFCAATASGLGARLGRFLKERHPGVASLSYDYGGADVKCNESNSDTDRALPEWNYSASDNIKRTLGSFREMPACNADISFAGHACRHLGVAPALNGLRLAQDVLQGGWPWFVVIGPTWKQADRGALPLAKEILGFHEREIRWLGNTASLAEIALVAEGGEAYKGLFRILSEGHLPFDVIEGFRLAAPDLPKPLSTYKALIVPELKDLRPGALAALDAYVRGGGRLLAMGALTPGLSCLGALKAGAEIPRAQGRYLSLKPRDKALFKGAGLKDLDLLYLDSAFSPCKPAKGAKAFLRLVPETMFGPPEKCFLGDESRHPGAILSRHGSGRCLYLPWSLGRHYEPRYFRGHAEFFMAALGALGAGSSRLKLEAHPLLEVSHRADPAGRFEWLGLANHSGQNASAFHAPLPLRGIKARIRPARPLASARLLKSGRALKPKKLAGGWLEFRLPELNAYEVLLLELTHG